MIHVGVNMWGRVEGLMAERKISRLIERKGSDVICNAGLPLWSGNGGTDRETTTEAAGLWMGEERMGEREQIG